MTTVLTSLYFALIGLFVGSLLNVCIDRIPAGESIIRPPSHCSSCKKRIPQKDLIPLISYILLRGRCRYCGVKIPIRIFIVELTTAILFGLITWHSLSIQDGLSVHIAMPLIYTCIFIVIFFIDLEQQLIINMTIYIGIALALIFSFFWFQFFWPDFSIWPHQGTLSALLGGVTGAALILLPNIITRGRGMGGGDVMLAGFIGTATGFPLVIVALVIGIMGGGLTAIALVALRRKKRKDAIPFGPFLAVAAMVTLIWGPQILHWYSSWYQGT
jgi:leader peptidase (prepilin peptidase)/N-methyltransferase